MKERISVVAEALFATVVFLIGAIAGAELYNRGWTNDCEKIGLHIDRNKVYVCSRR